MDLIELIPLGLCGGAFSILVTRSRAFFGFRNFAASKFPIIGGVINCPFCFEHYVALMMVVGLNPKLTPFHPLVNFLVSWFTIVGASSISGGLIHRLNSTSQKAPDSAGPKTPD